MKRLSFLLIFISAFTTAFALSDVDSKKDLVRQIEQARDLRVEDLGVPVRATHVGELMLAPNPDGKTYDILQWYWKDYRGPTQVYIMDPATGEIKQETIPDGRQIHVCGRALAPNGKLYLATPAPQKGMEIYRYDAAANTLSSMGVVVPDLGGETREMCVGTDGKVYGTGSYGKEGKAGIYKIDPSTDEVTAYGAVGPSHAPNGVWGYSIAADERYIYVASGKVPWYLVAYDRETKTDKVLVTTEAVGGNVTVRQQRYGCTARAEKVIGTDGKPVEYWLYEGRAILKEDPKEQPPWKEPDEKKEWVKLPPRPEIWSGRAAPSEDDSAEIWYRSADAKKSFGKDASSDAQHGNTGWKSFTFKVPVYPMGITHLTELPDGRIFGNAGAYEGNFIFDPVSGKNTYLGRTDLSHYATAIVDGKVYMSGYPSSPLYMYDPAKPWTAHTAEPFRKLLQEDDKRSNPRRLLYMNQFSGTHKMYAAAVGADGRIYFGGRWMRNGSGGGLAWYDPKTGTAGGFWDIFSNYQINFMTAAGHGRYIVISTVAARDATLGKPVPMQGKIFVFDTKEGKIVREIEPIIKVRGAGLIVDAGGNHILGWTENPDDNRTSILYSADVETGKLAFSKVIDYPLPVMIGSNQQEAFDYRLGPDGLVWTFIANRLVRIDPSDASLRVVGKIGYGGRIAFSGNDIYLSGGRSLRRVSGLLADRTDHKTAVTH